MLRVVILNYKRPDNVHKIISAYKDKFPRALQASAR
jgi:hypothetical protein